MQRGFLARGLLGLALIRRVGCLSNGVATITSVKNAEILAAKRLCRSKRERDRSGLVFVEGIRLIQDILHAGHRPTSVFFCVERLVTPEASALLDEMLSIDDCELRRITPQVLESMVDTVTPQGLVALFPKPSQSLGPTPSRKDGSGEVLLLLDNIRDPGNMGTLLRSANALGAKALVVYGGGCVDPWGPKVLRSSMGGAFHIPLCFAPAWSDVAAYLREECKWDSAGVYAADASHASARDYWDVDWTQGNHVICVGSEAHGLSSELAALMPKRSQAGHGGDMDNPTADQSLLEPVILPIQVPMVASADSLNAAIAGSIILSEVQRQRAKINLSESGK
uniref:RNA 2-O ribose methyltransferase substrate binding domain-containing protein n=1 Tax=Pinguiococcus pyrenoidosus TaxID=172671 RepID=A0A7R9YBL7_9STRA|mmetsp:Transcript_18902/g.71559  ORF Transcript_18902/g.71559 Transcript_18902/m.71559 type:complete len:338 (+) Transcript_18902:37-1050(+)